MKRTKTHSDLKVMFVITLLTAALVGCGPDIFGNDDEQATALTGGEIELPEGQDEVFVEGLVAPTSTPGCVDSDLDGWCNPDGKSGCRSGRRFRCAMGQRCAALRYVDRDGAFAGCTWEDAGPAPNAPTTYCSAQVGGYCKSARVGVGCDNNNQKTFYCAGAGNSCETRTCGRMTLTGCSRNHPCNGIRGTFAACYPGQRRTCWWNGYKGHQRCEGGNWSWMCYAQADPGPQNGGGAVCAPGDARPCHWNGLEGHQTCDGGGWSYLCHVNGDPNPQGPPQCAPPDTKPCHWNGYPGHQTCRNGRWSELCYTNNQQGSYGAECHPGDKRPCWWNGHDGHQTCEGNKWSWLCHTEPEPPQQNGCHPGQERPCDWKGNPGVQRCHGGDWSYLCYTF